MSVRETLHRLSQRRFALRRLSHVALPAFFAVSAAGPAFAQSYEFLAAPEIELNRVYRLDKATGEIGACQYGEKEGTIGVTLCYTPGEGATGQPPSQYGLVSSRHEREGGVFRVDYRTGAMSICYVLKNQVVCTPPGK